MSTVARGRAAYRMLAALALILALAPLLSRSTALASSASGTAARPQLSRAQVLRVQHLFEVLGYPLGHKRLGGFGVRTRGAVSYFQHKYGLPVTGYPDPRTLVEMRAVAASLTAHPRSAPTSARRDLVGRVLGGVPILPLGILCALGLALLALAVDRKRPAGM
jgi:peptidoglycan hydrolase-like protein with peptidoglycan-binding domain